MPIKVRENAVQQHKGLQSIFQKLKARMTKCLNCYKNFKKSRNLYELWQKEVKENALQRHFYMKDVEESFRTSEYFSETKIQNDYILWIPLKNLKTHNKLQDL